MEIRVDAIQLPERIGFNYEELKRELTEKVSMYETMVYTDDQIKEAKADKANLNKLKKALNDERIRREKEYMEPFNVFKSKVNEIISIIDKPVAVIDKQVKEYEEKQKQDKLAKIQEYYNSIEKPDLHWLGLPAIYNEKWLNASVSMKSIQEEINTRLEQIEMDMKILADLPEYGFEAMEAYKNTLDVRSALNEANRFSEMAKRKAEQERLAAEAAKHIEEFEDDMRMQNEAILKGCEMAATAPVQEEESEDCDNFIPDFAKKLEKKWIVLKANITTDDEAALKQFFEERNIEFEVL
ncbi:MAG: DUF1351 domain-containing protein [Roseburia sp.]|nr:DUF1351 domain-containing protein [Roseburia sp.]MBQ8279584.1 DUF1351 domain-containing protein [Roseburia sp.]